MSASAGTRPDEATLPDGRWRQRFRRRLLNWYARHARDLPWRRHGEPYPIWVSEIMLQQTQVATVRGYFERFMAAFPTIEALARADEHDVLRLWEGLGYYRRARQLHQAARKIIAEHGGRFPRDAETVRRLPGIGRYTAGAILSIAFDAREPILEANTIRLLARLLAYQGDPRSAAGTKLLWQMAEAVLPRREAGRFNQAMMELGSEVCTPKAPRCDACPVAALCPTREAGLQDRIPAPKAKTVYQPRHEVALVVRRRGRVLLMQCPEGGRWAGLWDFPRFEVQAEHPDALERELVEAVRRQTGAEIRLGALLATIKHGVTRYRITLDCYEAQHVAGTNGRVAGPAMRWLRPAELTEYPLSTTGRKLSRLVGG